jgi:hypothetical protein
MKSVTFPDLNTTRLTEPMLEHEVRLRSYERYQRRGRVDGHAGGMAPGRGRGTTETLVQDLLSLPASNRLREDCYVKPGKH